MPPMTIYIIMCNWITLVRKILNGKIVLHFCKVSNYFGTSKELRIFGALNSYIKKAIAKAYF